MIRVFLITCGFILVPSLRAQDVSLGLQTTSKTLSIGTANFPPFRIVGTRGEVGGVDAEIVKNIFRKLGYQIDLQVYPWARTYKLGETGRLPVIFSFTKNDEREKHFYFSDPINTVKDVLFKRRDRDLNWKSLQDLAGKSIGVSQGYSYSSDFMELMEKGVFKPDYAAGRIPELIHLRKLAKGRLDYFICEASVCSYLIQLDKKQFADIHYVNRVVGQTRTFHVGFSKANPEGKKLLQAFNKELARLAENGELEKLYRRFGIVNDIIDSSQPKK